ncbi:SO_0444 family Cu/Zn efflux transporter [uncultured Desulfobulbus sp.]|uniref:SO_0444 family Cu/Zn efflux transporter n=1 Tax=uncultured Desulfobulbus sp. TaxID=239745 RepID=UPI0029C9B138|nr:SO_0444 family Cu/Zn efflux transporter [uncultured Desulfobulbus sp.]
MHYFTEILIAAWTLLEQSSLYILFGLAVGGLLKMFLSADYVAAHLGTGKIKSVFKAALLGVPIPLCSCGVLPAAAQLKKQGANNGATTAFLISTPESGVDSIAVSWALLDPLMTVARPLAAFLSAFVAGVLENMLFWREGSPQALRTLPMALVPASTCATDDCGCAHNEPPPIGLWSKLTQGLRYAITDIWGDLAGWFFVGIAIAACITVFIPDDLITRHLGGGIGSMLLMLAVGIPMYICATASTPIAAALILKGVSPGAALVFLLAGPATNITALAVLIKILGKRGMAVYLVSISVVSVLCGLALDGLYFSLGLSAAATIGEVAETLPHWLMLAATGLLLVLSLPILGRWCFRKNSILA